MRIRFWLHFPTNTWIRYQEIVKSEWPGESGDLLTKILEFPAVPRIGEKVVFHNVVSNIDFRVKDVYYGISDNDVPVVVDLEIDPDFQQQDEKWYICSIQEYAAKGWE